jgi:hypothetical protein
MHNNNLYFEASFSQAVLLILYNLSNGAEEYEAIFVD